MTATTREQAYYALQAAAERVGAANYKQQIAAHIKRGRSRKTFRFTVTEGHRALVDAMPAVLAGEITVEEAFALLHYGQSAYELSGARKAA